jgi:predicted DNA-binding ribbon-helix-helix protein
VGLYHKSILLMRGMVRGVTIENWTWTKFPP